MAASPFDILNAIFNGSSLSVFSDQELKNNGFTIQRLMSIKYPLQAQSQNVLGVNMIGVVKYWAVNMKGKFVQMPNWTRIATAKLRKEYQEKLGTIELPKKEVLEAFMQFHGLDEHEFKFLMEHKASQMVEMLKIFENNYDA